MTPREHNPAMGPCDVPALNPCDRCGRETRHDGALCSMLYCGGYGRNVQAARTKALAEAVSVPPEAAVSTCTCFPLVGGTLVGDTDCPVHGHLAPAFAREAERGGEAVAWRVMDRDGNVHDICRERDKAEREAARYEGYSDSAWVSGRPYTVTPLYASRSAVEGTPTQSADVQASLDALAAEGVHVNTRGCEPMSADTVEALGEVVKAARKMRTALFDKRVDPLTEQEIHGAFACWQEEDQSGREFEYIQNFGKDPATVRQVVCARALGAGEGTPSVGAGHGGKYRLALVNVMAHTGRTGADGHTPNLDLANGLLDSIARIAGEALEGAQHTQEKR